MSAIFTFSDEQLRALVNLRQRYEVWVDAERESRALPYDLRRKTVGKYEYLYEITDRSGNGASLGRWDAEKEREFLAYHEQKERLKQRLARARSALDETCRIARAVGVPQLSSSVGPILREADLRGLLDGQLLVVGTNCIPAYAQEAGGNILGAADETEDFDLAWTGADETKGAPVWSMLKAVDPTFTVNSEREFQARNADAYEVELLAAPSRIENMGPHEKPRPVPLPEQEWLLLGNSVDQIVICRDASPARIVAPDPRWFALQKLWMSAQPKRNPLKRRKDRAQGMALLDSAAQAMPQFALDDGFIAQIPAELETAWADWSGHRKPCAQPSW